jgi:hypothetical protein
VIGSLLACTSCEAKGKSQFSGCEQQNKKRKPLT